MDCLESSIVCLEFLCGNFKHRTVSLKVIKKLIAVDFLMLGWFEKKPQKKLECETTLWGINLANKACQSADITHRQYRPKPNSTDLLICMSPSLWNQLSCMFLPLPFTSVSLSRTGCRISILLWWRLIYQTLRKLASHIWTDSQLFHMIIPDFAENVANFKLFYLK